MLKKLFRGNIDISYSGMVKSKLGMLPVHKRFSGMKSKLGSCNVALS